ncbi:MAG: hypothetical protein HOP13_00540 [Alphaproteobacteria bacterium]|nr:hypothetical protein [Alphaproteobacteria bacterium]
MKVSRAALLIAVAAMVAGPATAAKKKAPAAPKCIKDKVLSAFQMRMLQTELVVGALSCKMTPRYNDFVVGYRPDLMSAHKTMMKYFGRESRLEDYKSRTANEASQRSLANITEFCLYSSALYDKLLGPEKVKLVDFAMTEPVANRHGQDVCGNPALVTASTTGKVVPMPRAKPEVAGAPAAPAATEASAVPSAPPQQ